MPVDDTGKRDDEWSVEKWAYEKDMVTMCDFICLYQ